MFASIRRHRRARSCARIAHQNIGVVRARRACRGAAFAERTILRASTSTVYQAKSARGISSYRHGTSTRQRRAAQTYGACIALGSAYAPHQAPRAAAGISGHQHLHHARCDAIFARRDAQAHAGCVDTALASRGAGILRRARYRARGWWRRHHERTSPRRGQNIISSYHGISHRAQKDTRRRAAQGRHQATARCCRHIVTRAVLDALRDFRNAQTRTRTPRAYVFWQIFEALAPRVRALSRLRRHPLLRAAHQALR